MNFLHTRLVTRDEWRQRNKRGGSVYFIKNDEVDKVKIGFSNDPFARLGVLQVGSANRLRLIGIIAAPFAVEAILHSQFREGHSHGEWFYDRGIISQYLTEMTYGEPMCRNIWELVPGREFFGEWDAETGKLIKHYWNPVAKEWEPPFAKTRADVA